ncbi:MAG: carbohydrate kinase family protein [Anaerolineales bacterium]
MKPQPNGTAVKWQPASMYSASGWLPTTSSASIAVSRLGLASAFAGYLGTDPFGDYLLNDFVTANVNIDLLVRGPAPTSISAVFVTPSGKRSLVNYRAPEPIPAGALDVSNVCAKVILFDGHEPEQNRSTGSPRRDPFPDIRRTPKQVPAGTPRSMRSWRSPVMHLQSSSRLEKEVYTGITRTKAGVFPLSESMR